jgi:hypothetical protein
LCRGASQSADLADELPDADNSATNRPT